MKYLAVPLISLLIASCASTTPEAETTQESSEIQTVEIKTVANSPDSTSMKSQYGPLNLLEQVELYQYAQSYRYECVRPSEAFYLTMARLKKATLDKGISLSRDELSRAMSVTAANVKAAKGNDRIEPPTLALASSPDSLVSLEKASNKCFDKTLKYFNESPNKYIADSSAPEFHSYISFLSAYLEAKNNLLIRSYALETNGYRSHPDTTTLALDGYTEFMFRVYQFIASSNRLLKGSELTNEMREKLINSVRELKESRNKIGKDFDLYEGLQLVFTLAKYKQGDWVDFSEAFQQHENALNESIDTFYPLIDEMEIHISRSSPDTAKTAELMLRFDTSLTLHEGRVSELRSEITKTQMDMIMQAGK